MRLIDIPDNYSFNRREKVALMHYLSRRFKSAINTVAHLKKTKHERLFQLIKLHSYVKIKDYSTALNLTKYFYPFVRRDDIDASVFFVLSELYFAVGFKNIARFCDNNYYYIKNINVDNVIVNYNTKDNNYYDLIGMFLSQNDLVILAFIHLLSIKEKKDLGDEFNYFRKTNYRFNELVKKTQSLIMFFDKVFFIAENPDEYYFLKKLINKLNPNIETVYLTKNSGFTLLKTDNTTNALIGKTNIFIDLMKDFKVRKKMEVYFESIEDFTLNCTSIYLYGDYFKTMNFKYKYNIEGWNKLNWIYNFSIVIPVRNEGEYLKYAIESCLKQTFSGTYEVLICDNSDEDNHSVLECVQSFKNKKIRYIKTPEVLPLNRSFEYAFLNAKGKYLLSIGSDDSILSFSLELLDCILHRKQYDVLSWGNARYEWGSSKNKQRPNLMLRKAFFDETVFESKQVLDKYYKGNLDFGYLPKLYLGSCFSRDLIDRFITETGKFEDGYSQDIYTGLKTCMLTDEIYRFGFPLTVSGVSFNSTGLNDVLELRDLSDITNRLKKMALLYENNTFYCAAQRVIIDCLLYAKTFSLLEYSEILKANNYNSCIFVNPFIQPSLSVNPRLFCDIDFIVSGLKKFESFYNGKLGDNIEFSSRERLSQRMAHLFPFLYFYYINHFHNVRDGYRVCFVYGKKLKNSSILDANLIVEKQTMKYVRNIKNE